MILSDEISLADQVPNESLSEEHGWTPPAFASAQSAVAAPVVNMQHEAELAREQGYQAGLAEGLAAARAQGEQAVAEINTLLASLATAYTGSDAQLLRDILDLSSQISRAVLRRELATDSDTLASVIGEALELLAEAPATTELTLHPDDARYAREHGLLDQEQVIIRESERLQRGGIELRSGSTLLDASVEARLQAVLEALYLDAGLPPPADSSLPKGR